MYLFLALAVIGAALLLALLFLPDHREADAKGMFTVPPAAARSIPPV
jgi:hypothetical protein